MRSVYYAVNDLDGTGKQAPDRKSSSSAISGHSHPLTRHCIFLFSIHVFDESSLFYEAGKIGLEKAASRRESPTVS
jgi:hypothetical protein